MLRRQAMAANCIFLYFSSIPCSVVPIREVIRFEFIYTGGWFRMQIGPLDWAPPTSTRAPDSKLHLESDAA